MKGLFRFVSGVGSAAFVAKIADKINEHPRYVRFVVLVLLNLIGFFCFYIVIYGVGLKLEPPKEHRDYKLMSFGIKFVSFVVASLVSVGLYHLVQGIVAARKFVSDQAHAVSEGLKDRGKVFSETSKKAADITKRTVEGAGKGFAEGSKKTFEVTKKGTEVGTQWIRANVPRAGKAVREGLKSGAGIVKERVPAIGKTISAGSGKVFDSTKVLAKKATEQAKEKLPVAIRSTKDRAIAIIKKIVSLLKRRGRRSTEGK